MSIDAVPVQPVYGSVPGQFSIRTYLKNSAITARDGGHHSVDALVTNATSLGPNERFTIETAFGPFTTLFKTAGGYYVSAIQEGGADTGNDAETFQTERTAVADDARFMLVGPVSDGRSGIRTFNGHFVTALGGGGLATRAFHTDATQESSWEWFFLLKCGDLGSGYQYAIRPAGTGGPDHFPKFLDTYLVPGTVTVNSSITASFRLIRQNDGSYALQTPDFFHYVTAVDGGGLAHGSNLQTDRTQVQAWEQFKIVEYESGIYTIQTVSGFYVAVGPDSSTISTRISDPDAAPGIGYNAKFELIMVGL